MHLFQTRDPYAFQTVIVNYSFINNMFFYLKHISLRATQSAIHELFFVGALESTDRHKIKICTN